MNLLSRSFNVNETVWNLSLPGWIRKRKRESLECAAKPSEETEAMTPDSKGAPKKKQLRFCYESDDSLPSLDLLSDN